MWCVWGQCLHFVSPRERCSWHAQYIVLLNKTSAVEISVPKEDRLRMCFYVQVNFFWGAEVWNQQLPTYTYRYRQRNTSPWNVWTVHPQAQAYIMQLERAKTSLLNKYLVEGPPIPTEFEDTFPALSGVATPSKNLDASDRTVPPRKKNPATSPT